MPQKISTNNFDVNVLSESIREILTKNISVRDIKEILRRSILLEEKLNEIGLSYEEFHKRF